MFFAITEKSLLTELVQTHKDLQKINKLQNLTAENKTWKPLSEQFNSQSNVTKSDAKQLKNVGKM